MSVHIRKRITMRFAAWLSIAAGIICCLVNAADFNDRNLAVMLGIGFIVGGFYLIGVETIVRLLNRERAGDR